MDFYDAIIAAAATIILYQVWRFVKLVIKEYKIEKSKAESETPLLEGLALYHHLLNGKDTDFGAYPGELQTATIACIRTLKRKNDNLEEQVKKLEAKVKSLYEEEDTQ